MALILSLESSSNICGVCLSSEIGIIGAYSLYERNLHDKFMAELIRRLLNDCNLSVSDLDAVAVSEGPGSFTGLRIGGSIAKGLCFSGKPKLVAVPTLDSIAFAAVKLAEYCNKPKILASLGSHKDLYYCRLYNNKAQPVSQIETLPLAMLQEKTGSDMLFVGHVSPEANKTCLINEPKAEYIGALAQILFNKAQFTDPEDFAPLYVQEFVPKGFNKQENR